MEAASPRHSGRGGEGRPRPRVVDVYRRLRRRFGRAGWWPAQTPFEVCLGAILTQSTSWTNVEKALEGLRRRGLLSYEALKDLPASRLAPRIRSSGFFRVKARRVRAFTRFLGDHYGGRVEAMAEEPLGLLRAKLLGVPGIGPETADSILLYAVGLPTFVVDACTRRVFSRLGLLSGRESYDEIQSFFTSRLPPDVSVYNDYHAQIVRLAKEVCRKRPRCLECPLGDICPRKGIPSRAPRTPPRRARMGSVSGASRFRRER
jgi:endonuclease-3 related protein